MSSLLVNTNVAALDTIGSLDQTNSSLDMLINELSTGLRVANAATGPADYTIGQNLEAQSNGFSQAISNAQNGTSLLQTASGALNEITSALQTMYQLASTSASTAGATADTLSANQAEFASLAKTITGIATSTTFAKTNLLTGSFSGTLQVGAFNTAADQMNISIASVTLQGIGLAGSAAKAEGSALTVTNGEVTLATAATLEFKVTNNGNSTSYSIKLTAGKYTTGQLVTKINSVAGNEVTAAVAHTATADTTKLTLTTVATGSNVKLTVTANATELGFKQTLTTAAKLTATTAVTHGTLDIVKTTTKFTLTVGGVSKSYTFTADVTDGKLTTVTSALNTAFTGLAKFSVATTTLVITSTATGPTATLKVTTNATFGFAAAASSTGETGVSAHVTGATVTHPTAVGIAKTTTFTIQVDGKAHTYTFTAAVTKLATAVTDLNTAFKGLATFSVAATKVVVTTTATGQTTTLKVTNFTALGFKTVAKASGNNGQGKGTATGAVTIDSSTNAQAAMTAVLAAIDKVATVAAQIGAAQNSLEVTVADLTIGQENLSAAESQVVDATMAQTMTNYTTENVLEQSGIAMLSQAQTEPQLALKLLSAI